MTLLFSSNTATHTFDILIKPESEGTVSAIALGLPEYRAEGCDRASALAALQQLLTANLAQAEIISIEIAVPQSENPWLKMAGRFKDDPYFDDMLDAIAAYRRELDVERENDLHEPDLLSLQSQPQ